MDIKIEKNSFKELLTINNPYKYRLRINSKLFAEEFYTVDEKVYMITQLWDRFFSIYFNDNLGNDTLYTLEEVNAK